MCNDDNAKTDDICNVIFTYFYVNEVEVLKRGFNDLHKEHRDTYEERSSLKIEIKDLIM